MFWGSSLFSIIPLFGVVFFTFSFCICNVISVHVSILYSEYIFASKHTDNLLKIMKVHFKQSHIILKAASFTDRGNKCTQI